MIRTVFMGTPEIAVPSLQMLLTSSTYDVVGVVTQPDRKAGRGRKLKPSPIKQVALEAGVPTILQPRRLREATAFEALAALQPELIVVTAYGQILRPEVLALPRYGCINVHASLLPRWRGASPIAAAILAGDAQTGVTLMQMDKGMDTGPILSQRAESIRPDDTSITLGERLGRAGAELLGGVLSCYLAGSIQPYPQTEQGATVCRLIKKEHARIDWQRPAQEIERMVRAYQPWPGAFSWWQGQMVKIGAARVVAGTAKPGQVMGVDGGAAVGTGRDLLFIEALQIPGKRMMAIADFLRGRSGFVGSFLGDENE